MIKKKMVMSVTLFLIFLSVIFSEDATTKKETKLPRLNQFLGAWKLVENESAKEDENKPEEAGQGNWMDRLSALRKANIQRRISDCSAQRRPAAYDGRASGD